MKPYNTPAETPKPDKQDSSNESHQDQGHDSHENSHDSHLSDDSSSASSISKASTEGKVIKGNENEVQSQDDHINHIKSPSNKRSILVQQSSPQPYDPAEFSNNECDNAFIASDLHDCSDNTEFQISLHDSNHNQFICSTLFQCGGYFPSFVPIYPKTLSEVSPIKHVSLQSNENEGM